MSATIHVNFTRGTGIGGAFVRWWTRSKYAHVSISTPYSCIDAAPGRGVGFRQEPIGAKRVSFEVTASQLDRLSLFIDAEYGCKYDWLGDFACGLPWAAREKENAWFCSEFSCAALQSIGILRKTIEPWRLSPQMLYELISGHPDALYEATPHG